MILRVCVVIPSFDNARTISEVVKDVITNCSLPVLIVDDGSETPVSHMLYSWEVRQALEEGRVHVERLEKKQGKGAALRFAVQKLVAEGFTHMLTMEGDGQHFGREIAKLLQLCAESPDQLILGDRRLKPTEPPQKGWRGRLANFWVGYQTGSHIQDAQSGFRLYPLFHLQTMSFWTKGQDFDLEVLIRLLWNGVHVRETFVECKPAVTGERPPLWFRLWNDLRSSALSMTLLVVSLLKTHRSPVELATALGLGVFVGCTPFFGFHTLMVAGLALAFRLNVVVMWLGTHVSTPLIAPLVVYAEIWIGKHWLPIAENKGEFYQWVAGSLVLGVSLGFLSALAAFLVSWGVQRRKLRDPRHERVEVSGFSRATLRFLLRHFGLRAAPFWELFWVNSYFNFGFRLRAAWLEYWSLVQPELSWRARQKKVFRQLKVHARMRVEKELACERPESITVNLHVGEDFVTQIAPQSRLISAHLGDWAFTRAQSKLPRPLIESSVQPLLLDRPGTRGFELIPFFGKLAPFDTTPFLQAAEQGTPLVVTFGVKSGPLIYELYAKPARFFSLETKATSPSLLAYRGASAFVVELEKFVKRFPEQWANYYPFWSELPAVNGRHEFFEDLLPPAMLKPEAEDNP